MHNNTSVFIPLPLLFSIISAKLYATKTVITCCQDFCLHDSVIFSDSLSALITIKNFRAKKSHSLSQKIVKLLQTQNNHIIFCEIPSHTNTEGNKLVDYCAKKAYKNFPMNNTSILLSELKLHVKNLMLKQFQTFWTKIPQTNKIKNIKTTKDFCITTEQNSRRTETILTRLRIGHTFLTHHYLFLKYPPPLCPQCNTLITVSHILVECSIYQIAQIKYLSNQNPKILLSDKQEIVSNVLQFLKTTRLYSTYLTILITK